MEKKAGEETLKLLKEMRAEMHGKLDKRDVRELRDQVDEAIAELERAMKHKDTLDKVKLLAIIGAVVEKIPLVVKAIERLSKK